MAIAASLAGLGVLPPGVARELDAHVHGASTLEMVVFGRVVQAALRGPAVNFYGFERAARTAEERAAIARTRAALEAPGDLLVWDSATRCRLRDAVVTLPASAAGVDDERAAHGDHEVHDEHEHDDDQEASDRDHAEDDHEHDDHEHAGSHADVVAEWTWDCGKVVGPREVAFRIHDAFPGTETVELTVLAADGSVAVRELTAGGQRIR